MGVRLSTSYSLLAGTNSDISLTSVVTGGRLRIGNADVDTSGGPAGQSPVRVTLAAAMGAVTVVAVDAAEAVRNVDSAVFTRRRGIGRRPRSDRHADHPVSATNFASRRRPGTSGWFGSGLRHPVSETENERFGWFSTVLSAESVSATLRVFCGWALTDSNHRPLGYEPSALTRLS